jgi:hypothetical protein
VSRHHTLPPIVYTPAPPKPREARRRRGVGSAQDSYATDETAETGAPTQPTFTRGTEQASPAPFEGAERHIPPTTGNLSADTLKTMLEVQEQQSTESHKDRP